jgi:4-amino-4-deoxy-L-arabinose transferase-like glycosyltransferase
MPWVSGWLLAGAALGIFALWRCGGLHLFEWWTAAAFFAQVLAILCYFALAQRYSADFYPFLIFCLALYLRTDDLRLLRARHVVIGLVAVAIVINPLATLSWTVEAEANVRPDTRAIWLRMLGRDVQ